MSLHLDRTDFGIIADWIKPGSSVLDLGCGDGTLMAYLQQQKQTRGYGIEIDDEDITASIKNGINVIHMDLNEGLSEFDEDSFDYVILSLTLQAMQSPELILKEMMRVGTEGIVTFPNFGNWKSRLQLALGGRMPVTKTLPNTWYNTPNIHLCTITDFEDLCQTLGFKIIERRAVDHVHKSGLGLKLFPNLLGQVALYRFKRA
ncbi:MAG: methionine biosynthesis protein MetW [Thiotrichales bacterium SG8_50]|jgi:methionine biosynthesis protein MetW|nr:MAG: methionine biosynthesis protein MetW [Thiotrichales bacterium SG8_50]